MIKLLLGGSNTIDRTTLILDDHGRVVRATLASESRAPSHLAKDVRFRYDEHGRLVGHTTDAEKFSEAGAEHDLPPGTISISYDDKARTKTTRYTAPKEGAMEFVVSRMRMAQRLGSR